MIQRITDMIWLTIASIALAFAIVFAIAQFANARDLGQWENSDPTIRLWYQNLRRGDGFPCCGEADAYWCDEVSVEGEKVFCAITDDREDAPLMRPHIAIGTKFEITPDKLAFKHGNPTGHSIVFVNELAPTIYCFVQNSGV